MSELAALIFDVDGTLADTERDGHRIAFNRAFAEAALDWHWSVELYGKLLAISGGKERIRFYLQQLNPHPHPHLAFPGRGSSRGWGYENITRLRGLNPHPHPHLAFPGRGSSRGWGYENVARLRGLSGGDNSGKGDSPDDLDEFIADLHAAKIKHYQQLLASGAIPLRPGVRRLLDEARTQAVRLAIATTSALPNATALLERTLAPSWFEVIAAGDIVPAKKPAPDIYGYVLAKMGLTPGECLVFEDSQHGLQAARQAGLKTVVTVNDYTEGQDFADAILLLNHLGEPEQHFTVLAGEVPDDVSYLDMALVRRLHSCF
ncbi:MAG: HAD-IA family hydrolase [Hormoscilla sp. SP12CHS1]|nr:HAD-IA family hydrolase [Hormoscilla sp. SP12CHS1]